MGDFEAVEDTPMATNSPAPWPRAAKIVVAMSLGLAALLGAALVVLPHQRETLVTDASPDIVQLGEGGACNGQCSFSPCPGKDCGGCEGAGGHFCVTSGSAGRTASNCYC